MTDLRIYAGTSGDCIAGDRYTDYTDEKRRVQADFLSGIRFTLDERHREIRGFVPADRGSSEAFYAALSVPDGESIDPATFAERVRELFDRVEGWSIRTETPEGQLFDALEADTSVRTAFEAPVKKLGGGSQIHVGVPDLKTAGKQLQALWTERDSGLTDYLFVISISQDLDHLKADLILHASVEYDAVETLDV